MNDQNTEAVKEKTAKKTEEKPAEGKHGIDMTHGRILPKILRFAAPSALSSILQTINKRYFETGRYL